MTARGSAAAPYHDAAKPLRANPCHAENFPRSPQTKNDSRGIMEFHEETKRGVENTPGSITAGRMAEDLSSLGDKAKSNIAEAAESARAEARRIANQQKNVGADRLNEVAGAVYGAARSLEAGMPQMASYVHGAAARLEGAAKTLRHRNIDDLMDEIGGFARSQPAIFFGGAMLAGFALARFLKSSGQGAGRSWRRANAQTEARGR